MQRLFAFFFLRIGFIKIVDVLMYFVGDAVSRLLSIRSVL